MNVQLPPNAGDAIGEPLAERHLCPILRDGVARDWLAMNEPMNDVALDLAEPLELVRDGCVFSAAMRPPEENVSGR